MAEVLVTPERPTAVQIAQHAWSSLREAGPWIWPLLLAAFLLLVAGKMGMSWLHEVLGIATRDALRAITKAGDQVTVAAALPSIGLDIAAQLISSLVLAPIAVAMHRFILLGKCRSYPAPAVLRFATWIFASKTLMLIGLWLMIMARNSAPLFVLVLFFVLEMGLAILLLKTLLLFPSIAVEEQSRGEAGRIESALDRGDGIFWLTIWSFVLTILPVAVARAVLAGALTAALILSRLDPGLSLAAMLLDIAGQILAVAFGAATLSWLYSYAAHRKAE